MSKRDKVILFVSRFAAGIFCFLIPKLITGEPYILRMVPSYFNGLDIADYAFKMICFLVGTIVIMYSFSIFAEKK